MLRKVFVAILIALVASGEADAQARGRAAVQLRELAKAADTPERRTSKLAELDVWLRRLPGSYRVRGMVTNNMFDYCAGRPPRTCYFPPAPPPLPIEGKADCVQIGAGPGVHCIFDVSWEVPAPPVWQLVWDPWLVPGVMLFGLNIDTPGIRYLEVNHRSIAEDGELGELKGDEVTFRYKYLPHVRNASSGSGRRSCPGCRTMRITAPEDGDSVRLSVKVDGGSVAVNYDFKLERVVGEATP